LWVNNKYFSDTMSPKPVNDILSPKTGFDNSSHKKFAKVNLMHKSP